MNILKVFVIFFMVFESQLCVAKGNGNRNAQGMTDDFNNFINEACRGQVTYEFKSFYSEYDIPEDLVAGLYGSGIALRDACTADLTRFSKAVSKIVPKSGPGDQLSYELKGGVLHVAVGNKFFSRDVDAEAAVLRDFLRKKTGLALPTLKEQITAKEKIERDQESQKSQQKDAKLDAKNAKALSSADEISARYKVASVKYQTEIQAIWAGPGNDAASMAKKQKAAADAQAEFARAQIEFQSGIDGLKSKK